MSRRATAAAVFLIGFVVSLAGDACHVASGTTRYELDGVPTIWKSAIWFPFAVGGAVLAAAWLAERLTLPRVRVHDRAEAIVGIAAVLALYALTAALRHQPMTVSVVLTAAIALGVWAWWDPSPRALAIATSAAIAGPLGEIALVQAGAASYAPNADDLGGVAPWLPFLYFAAGAVASGVWPALAGPSPARAARNVPHAHL